MKNLDHSILRAFQRVSDISNNLLGADNFVIAKIMFILLWILIVWEKSLLMTIQSYVAGARLQTLAFALVTGAALFFTILSEKSLKGRAENINTLRETLYPVRLITLGYLTILLIDCAWFTFTNYHLLHQSAIINAYSPKLGQEARDLRLVLCVFQFGIWLAHLYFGACTPSQPRSVVRKALTT